MAMTAAKDALPYEGGGGAGGKFQKNTFRRRQNTPYDRPPTALRSLTTTTTNSNSWISKVVNPASKLITSSAHWLFGSMFQKRLHPAPPQQPHLPVSEAREEVAEKFYQSSSTGIIPLENAPHLQQQNTNEVENPSNISDSNGFTELEQILKQKTFTRSEIERLTSLLHSRTLAIPESYAENRANFALAAQDGEGIQTKPPTQGNEIQNFKLHGSTSSPIPNSRVLEKDVASPSEIAKAYMGSKSSKAVSPLGVRSQTFRETPRSLSNVPFTSTSPIISMAANVGMQENFSKVMTPISRGRSSMYNMPRTPYSKIRPASSHKDSVNAVGGSFSSLPQYGLEGRQFWVYGKTAPKRGRYTLDNDNGSIGPIRRIRQKPNMWSSKNMSVPASETPSTSYAPIPSQSSDVAQKILQQLDRLTPSKDKSPEVKLAVPMKESPLKSRKDVNFSRPPPLVNAHDNAPPQTSLLDAQCFTSQKQDKAEVNSLSKAVNGVEATFEKKDSTPIVNCTDSSMTKPAGHPHPHKKRAFRMSAFEDNLELDENGDANNIASTSYSENKGKQDASMVVSKSSLAEAVEVVIPPVIFESKPLDSENFKGITFVEKSNTVLPFSAAPAAKVTIKQAVPSSMSNSDINQVQLEETKPAPPIFNFSSNNMDNKVSPFGFSSTPTAGEFKGSISPVQDVTGATGITFGVPESNKDGKSIQKVEDLFNNVETTLPSATLTPSTTHFSFGGSSANIFTVSHGSLSSTPSTLSSPTPVFAFAATTTPIATTSNIPTPVSFGFGNTDTQVKNNNKQETTPTFGSTVSSPITTSTGASIFGFGASNNSLGVNPFGSTSSEPMANVQASFGTGSASHLTQSTPVQFGSSSPAPSFGLIGANTGTASGTSPFNSGASFGLSSSSASSMANSTSSINGSSPFGSTWNPEAKSPIFSSASNTSSSPVFSFGGASVSAPSNNASTSSLFSFTQPVASNPNPSFAFGSPSSPNQMSMEDTMAEDDTVQPSSTPSTSIFGQTPNSAPSSGFMFNSTTTPSGPNPFQFGGQQNPFQASTPPPIGGAANPFQFGGQQQNSAPLQNPFQFGNQPSSSVATPTPVQSPFQASGSFSLGTGGGGGDKSNRRIVKVKRNVRKK